MRFMIDIARLRLLRELARLGTMTAVAAAFGMTSSAVSQQLATLERETRLVLLERVGRRVRLTAEGARLVSHAEAILQTVEVAELDLRAARDKPQGRLEIGCFSTYAKTYLLPAILRVRERFAESHIVVHELESVDAIEAVRDGRCDVAVTFAYNLVPHPEVAGLASRQLMEEPVWVALPKQWKAERNPIALERLAQENWIVGSRQTDDRLLAERACAIAGFAPRITHTADDYDLLLRMVGAGLGVGFVPELGIRFPSAGAVVVRTPAGAPLSRRIRALTRGALTTSPLVRALLSELTAETKAVSAAEQASSPAARSRSRKYDAQPDKEYL
jgi:DNA-binding transcriptional LysR family regulator